MPESCKRAREDPPIPALRFPGLPWAPCQSISQPYVRPCNDTDNDTDMNVYEYHGPEASQGWTLEPVNLEWLGTTIALQLQDLIDKSL